MRKRRLLPLTITTVILISIVTAACDRAAQEAAAEDIVSGTSPSEAHFGWFFAPFFMSDEDWDKWEYSPDAVLDHFFSDSSQLAGWKDPSIDITATAVAVMNLTPEAVSRLRDSFIPAGDSEDGRLVVTADTSPLPEGAAAVLAMELGGPIPLQDPDYYFTFAAVFDSDGDTTNNYQYEDPWDWDCYQGTDRWYELSWDIQMQEWNLHVGSWMGGTLAGFSSNASAMIDDNLVVFFIPLSEFDVSLPAYRLTAFGTDGSYAPEASGVDVVGDDPTEPLQQLPSGVVELKLDAEF